MEVLRLIKKVKIEVNTATWLSKPAPTCLTSLVGIADIDILEVLSHIAFRTSPPISYGFALGDLWAWFRYLPAISSDNNLRLRPEWDTLDSHQKTILSDDWGMGFSSSILTKSLDLVAVCPTNFLVERIPSISLGSSGKSGPKKSPDFIGIDKKCKLHIFECKGTQLKRKKLDEQLASGVPQKRNVKAPSGLIEESLVSGIFVPQYPSTEDAVFVIQDPEFEMDLNKCVDEEIFRTIILGEVASSVHLLGYPKLANRIAKDEDIEKVLLSRTIQEINSLEEVQIANAIYKKVNSSHKFDRFEIDGKDVYGLKVEIGLESKLLEKLLKGSNYSKLANDILNNIKNNQIPSWFKEKDDFSTTIRTPIGLYIRIEIVY
jgi:hypothetical protein